MQHHREQTAHLRALTQGQGDVEAEQEAYQQKYRERVVQNLVKRARQMGFELSPTAIT